MIPNKMSAPMSMLMKITSGRFKLRHKQYYLIVNALRNKSDFNNSHLLKVKGLPKKIPNDKVRHLIPGAVDAKFSDKHGCYVVGFQSALESLEALDELQKKHVHIDDNDAVLKLHRLYDGKRTGYIAKVEGFPTKTYNQILRLLPGSVYAWKSNRHECFYVLFQSRQKLTRCLKQCQDGLTNLSLHVLDDLGLEKTPQDIRSDEIKDRLSHKDTLSAEKDLNTEIIHKSKENPYNSSEVIQKSKKKLVKREVTHDTEELTGSSSALSTLNVEELSSSINDSNRTKKSRHFESLFQEIQVQREEEADKTVLINLDQHVQNRNHALKIIRRFRLPVQNLFFHKQMILVEFANPECVEKLLRQASYTPDNQFSMIGVKSNCRYLYLGRNNSQKMKFKDRTTSQFDIQSLKEPSGLSEDIMKCYELGKMTELDIRLRYFLTSTVKEVLRRIAPECKVHLFGSCVNGFGNRGCDIDIFADLQLRAFGSNVENEEVLKFLVNKQFPSEKIYKQQLLDLVGTIVRIFLPGASNVTKILQARVPIVKFKHTESGIECDICLDRSGVKMAELMFVWGELCPQLRPLMAVIKSWAANVEIVKNDTQGFSNFMMLMMTIFYMQSRNLAPTFSQLKKFADPSKDKYEFEGKDYSFCTNLDRIRKEWKPTEQIPDMGSLLQDFFQFYSTLDFEKTKISVVSGQIEKSNQFIITNPLDKSHNVGKNLRPHHLKLLKLRMKDACTILSKEDTSLYKLLSSKVKPQPADFSIDRLLGGGKAIIESNQDTKMEETSDSIIEGGFPGEDELEENSIVSEERETKSEESGSSLV